MNKKRLLICITSVLFVLIICFIITNNKTYANPTYEDNRIINPEWLTYINLTEDEKEEYQIIPSQYLDDAETEIDDDEILPNLPRHYNLRDYNLVSDFKNQGMTGLCWLYTGMTVFESNLRKNFNDSQILSIKQFDYARSNNIYEYRSDYKLNPYYTGRAGDGGDFSQYLKQISYGISPIDANLESSFQPIGGTYTIKDLFNFNNIEYYVTDAIDFGKNNYEENSEDYNKFMSLIKTYLTKYGAISLNSVYNENYVYNDEYSNTKVFSTEGISNILGHAITLIGWDDDYEYAYCKTERGTSSDLNNCDNIISGKGAWIIQNSHGENNNPIVYYTYSSSNIRFGVIKKIMRKDWDNNYDVNKLINESWSGKVVHTYQANKNERITRVSFLFYTADTFTIYFVDEENNRHLLESGGVNGNQLYSIDLSENNEQYLNLNGNTFSIEIEHESSSVPEVVAYSKIVTNKTDITAKTVIKDESIYTYSSSFMVYTSTHNIESGEQLTYIIKDSSGNDVTNRFEINSFYVLNNLEKVKVIINESITGNYTIETYYNSNLLDTTSFTVNTISGIGSGGNGSDSEPFIINTLADFQEIQNRGGIYLTLSYKLGSDIDMYDYLLNHEWISIGTSDEPFSGKLYGDGHTIKNLYVSRDTYAGLFGFIDNAKITNLKILNAHVEGMQAGILAANSYNSEFENVMISGMLLYRNSNTDIIKSLGSFIGVSQEDSLSKVSSYATIYASEDFSNRSNYVGGLIGRSSDSSIEGFLYKGNIISGVITGGVVGDAKSTSISVGTIIASIYNDIKIGQSSGVVGNISADKGGRASKIVTIVINVEYQGSNVKELYHTQNTNVTTKTIYYVNNNFETGINTACADNYDSVCGYIYPISKEQFSTQETYNRFTFSGQYSWNWNDNYPTYYQVPIYNDNIDITSEKYNIDTENGYIYNIKSVSTTKNYVTVEHFLDNIVSDSEIHIYKSDKSDELTNDEHISSNDILLVNGKYYVLSILGDCYSDGVVDIGDAVAIKRIVAGFDVSGRRNIYSCNISGNENMTGNIIDSYDAYILQKNLAKLSSEMYEGE